MSDCKNTRDIIIAKNRIIFDQVWMEPYLVEFEKTDYYAFEDWLLCRGSIDSQMLGKFHVWYDTKFGNGQFLKNIKYVRGNYSVKNLEILQQYINQIE